MPDDPAKDPKADPAKPADPPAADRKPADPAKSADPAKPETGATQAEVDKAYEKLREAEKERDALAAEKKKREDEELSENERLKRENEENAEKIKTATAKAQSANLLTALADKGLTGGQAKAAARLLDGVEYDKDTDEPVNLDKAIETAKATYGDAQFTPGETAKPPAPNLNPGPGNEPGPKPNLTAEELKAAEDSGMEPKAYEAMKDVRSFEDWQAARKRLETPQK
jgi:hypothetical protein